MKIKFRTSCLLALTLSAVLCHAQQTARQWNSEVTAGWNLGNQFECSALSRLCMMPDSMPYVFLYGGNATSAIRLQ